MTKVFTTSGEKNGIRSQGNSAATKSAHTVHKLIDNRPEALLQRRLDQMANKGSALSVQKKSALDEEGLLSGKFETIPIQRKVETLSGKFDTSVYETWEEAGNVGAEISLSFMPSEEKKMDCHRIGMVQVNRRTMKKGEQKNLNVTKYEAARTTDKGWAIDRTDWSENKNSDGFSMRNNNPVYQSEENIPEDIEDDQEWRISESLSDTGDEPKGRGSTWDSTEWDAAAVLKDKPSQIHPKHSNYDEVTDEFETAALDLEDATYLGSVKWGWKANSQGHVSLLPPEIEWASDGASVEYLEAADAWNAQKLGIYEHPDGTKKQIEPIKLPTKE